MIFFRLFIVKVNVKHVIHQAFYYIRRHDLHWHKKQGLLALTSNFWHENNLEAMQWSY